MIRLPRSGQVDLEFDGELIASGGLPADMQFPVNAKGKPVGDLQRGHRIEIYKTKKILYVIHYWFMSGWSTEPDNHEVYTFLGDESLARSVKSYTFHRLKKLFIGPPPSSQYGAANRERLFSQYRLQFEAAVSEALRGMKPEVLE